MADVVRITLTPTAAGAKASATIVPMAAENDDPNLPPSPEPPMKEQELPEGSREYMAATLLLHGRSASEPRCLECVRSSFASV